MRAGREGVSRFSVEIDLSHNTRTFCKGTPLCFRKIRVLKSFMQKRGISRFCVEIGLSHSTQTFCRGTLLCFRKTRASKSFMHKKGTSLFSVEIFCLTLPNNIAGEPFCSSKKCGSENFKVKEGELHGFVKNFSSHRTEKL